MPRRKEPKRSQPQDSITEALRTARILNLEDKLERETRSWLRQPLIEQLEAEKARTVTA